MDDGLQNWLTLMSKRVALKYCGGCNPGFDRVAYFKMIQDAAGESIHWVTLDDRYFDAVLIICGCDTACLDRDMDHLQYGQVLAVRDNSLAPEEIAEILLG
jgi:hypothetical protein